MFYADNERGYPCSKDPAVVKLGDRYYLYYSMPACSNGGDNGGWAIGIAESTDLEHWTRAGGLEPEQVNEKPGICAPGAIVLDGKVHLFYQTYGNFLKEAICHAVSTDGVHFIRDASNPVFAPTGSWTIGRAIDADVIPYGDKLMMYFATREPKGLIQILGVASAPLNSEYDSSCWTMELNDTILHPELEWEQSCIEAPALCEHGGKLFMFYAGAYNNCPQQIGCAVSNDGLKWKRVSDRPFLASGKEGEWNASESGHPFVYQEDERYYLFFQGNNDMGKTWHLSKIEFGFRENVPYLIGE